MLQKLKCDKLGQVSRLQTEFDDMSLCNGSTLSMQNTNDRPSWL